MRFSIGGCVANRPPMLVGKMKNACSSLAARRSCFGICDMPPEIFVSALASALMKISGTMDRIPQKDLRATTELQAFYIFPAGAGKAIGGLFSTHPPMEKRIAALQRLEAQLQGSA